MASEGDVIKRTPAISTASDGADDSVKDGQLGVVEVNVLQERTIGLFGAVSLVVNKIIGAGIFSTPSTIFKLSGSVGMALMCWVIGAIISTCGIFVMLEFGTAIPRSGGIKNYLERAFSPRLMQTCIYVFYCVFLLPVTSSNQAYAEVSASNAITFSSYILVAAGVDSTTWKLRGVAIAGAIFSVGIHTVAPRVGRGIQDVLSAVKLFTLLFIVCCGFAALAGHLRIESPHNFSNAFEGTSSSGYNIGSAILNVIFSFQGYDNVNAVLSEVRNPQRTLRLALPLSMGVIAVLYLLANVAYFAAVPKEAFIAAKVTVAATLFENVFGPSAGAKALPALVALSALGHLLGVAFTIPRLLQELAKDGVLPFSNWFMENRPFRTPIYALLLHLGVTILFICAPPAGDAFNFVVSLSSYPTTVLLFAITVGLVKLRLTDRANFQSPLPAPWILIVIYLAANIFLIVMPFVRPPNGKGSTSLPYWLSSVVALGILSLGIIYYTLRFVVVPRLLGYKHQEIQQELSDGSKVTRFQRIKR
ncbi:High-affinity methionine permease [Colletotrichum gloeosporioides]|uniref:High-affinity methionine permease n=1 Tax=Colletotrichum gloeosporioides TaxID=474922 RepID=A0A8H4CJU2_COLGL|nr:High-affinity methionine permease [Colletotrichum gloeosporioides]KAF3805087.1 High-affinity methionine permease [Colletotrichum gloeosporioides]